MADEPVRFSAYGPADGPVFLDRRFDGAGRPLRESGTTVIHHIADPAQNRALSAMRDRVAAVSDRAAAGAGEGGGDGEGGPIFAWLPPSSYHMTLFDLMLHSRRAPERWPAGLAADASDAAADDHVLTALRTLRLDDAPPFHVAPRAVYATPGGLGVALAGADGAEERRLRALRDRIAAATGLADRPGHDAYGFHITIAYLIARPDPALATRLDEAVDAAAAALTVAAPAFTLGPPEVCRFHDMTAFARAFDLV